MLGQKIILQTTPPEDWRPARQRSWRYGPNFLWNDPNKWPQQPIELNNQLSDQDEGVKGEKITVSTSALEENFWNVLFGRYMDSTWEKLRRLVAWLIQALHAFQRLWAASRGLDSSPAMLELKTSQTSIQELEAEKIIARNVQHQTYPKEYCNLESSKGPLVKLKPFMKERLLWVGGRLNRSDLDYNAKHPIILPGKHRITEMIILYYHSANGHVGPQQVLSETRQRFWIISGISSIWRVVQRCHECRHQSEQNRSQCLCHCWECHQIVTSWSIHLLLQA